MTTPYSGMQQDEKGNLYVTDGRTVTIIDNPIQLVFVPGQFWSGAERHNKAKLIRIMPDGTEKRVG